MRQDRRISLIGGLILLVATLAAGFLVYVVMQRQSESILSRSLQVSLQSNVRLFESRIDQALSSTRSVATRPVLIESLKLIDSEPGHAKGQADLQRAAESFLQTGFTGLSFYDARGREVASAGNFSRNPEQRVALTTKVSSALLWDEKFILHVGVDMLDQQGRRVGMVKAETVLPLLTRVFDEAVSVGKTGEFGVCAPPADDTQKMDCFLRKISGKEFKRYPRVINGKPLPMDYALNGATGLIHTQDYRREKVVAAYEPVSSFGLGMVLKIDQAELYFPVIAQLKFVGPLLAALVMAGMLLLNFLVTPLVRKLVHSERVARDANVQLHNSESQLRLITDAVPALIAYVDAEQRFRFHNLAYEKAFGLSYQQIEGKTLREVMGDEFYEFVRPWVEEVLLGYPVVYERTHKLANGEFRDFSVNYFPRFGEGDEGGQVMGFYSLSTDITELKRIDRMKSEFVSTVSHELRTPLTSIRGSLGLISGGVAGELPEAAKTLVGIAKNNCERLIRLINDILDIEKLESGKMQLDSQVVELKPLMVQALAANEGYGAERHVGLSLHFPDDKLQVDVDSDRLTQVITNLLSNAMKFSPPGANVDVHVIRSGLGVRVEVRDHGPGIPEEFRNRIFQKFSQADSSDTRQKGGTGLGLHISRAIIERMGGSIDFVTQAGVGTTFFFELPEWKELPALIPSTAALAGDRPRILICEDDHDVARLIGMVLDNAGFDSDLVFSAGQARAQLAQASYAAMTVDLKLPDQDGLELIRSLRQQERTRDLPIVVVSALSGEVQMRFNNQSLTVSDWLEKPIDENQLILGLRRAIDGLARR